MRLSPETGKRDCLVLDFAGNLERFGPIDQIRVKSKNRKPGELLEPKAPTKICPLCRLMVPISVSECPCGHIFPVTAPHEAEASVAPVLSQANNLVPAVHAVSDVTYSPHIKEGKPTSMKVTYRCGHLLFREWVCFEHKGYPRTKAETWWSVHGGQLSAPATVEQAIARQSEFLVPKEVWVRRTDDFFTVIAVEFYPRLDPTRPMPVDPDALPF
jgi:DNA repair protein RadD